MWYFSSLKGRTAKVKYSGIQVFKGITAKAANSHNNNNNLTLKG